MEQIKCHSASGPVSTTCVRLWANAKRHSKVVTVEFLSVTLSLPQLVLTIVVASSVCMSVCVHVSNLLSYQYYYWMQFMYAHNYVIVHFSFCATYPVLDVEGAFCFPLYDEISIKAI